jgi:hypothetical protein
VKARVCSAEEKRAAAEKLEQERQQAMVQAGQASSIMLEGQEEGDHQEMVTNPLQNGVDFAEQTMHDKYADTLKLIEEELHVLKKIAASSLKWLDGTHKCLFICQIFFNGAIMSAASFEIPGRHLDDTFPRTHAVCANAGKMLAGLALANTVIKGLETHFKFEHTVEILKETLKTIKHLEHDFKHLKIDASTTHDEFEKFKKEYDHAMKKLKAHL